MTDIVAAAAEKPRGKKGLLIPLVVTLVLGGAGFASSYLGFWSPSGMLSGPEEPVQSTEHMSVEFIDIPTIDVISREISFIGNLVGTYVDLQELMTLTAQGQVTLHTSTYPLDAINDAMADLDQGRLQGRGILVPAGA